MSSATAVLPCPFCDQPLARARGACDRCHAPADAVEQGQALAYAVRWFEQWRKAGAVFERQHRTLAESYAWRQQALAKAIRAGKPSPANVKLPPADRCWSCKAAVDPAADSVCRTCGAVLDSPAADTQRLLIFLGNEIKAHEEAGTLTLAQAHALLGEVRERLAAVRTALEKQRVPRVEPAGVAPPRPAPKPARPVVPRRPLWEILLDPRNIQWLLIFGAALLVLGLVIYLYTVGFFQNPAVVAGLMGTATLGVMAGGWAVIRFTRYQVAGRAITLLACLVLPLNLWFYHAQGLEPFTLYDRLWVAAVGCCVLYAASAWVLRDPLFVYVLVGGVTMTGLLILADVDGADQFWQVTHPATLLVVLGLLAVHTERAFPDVADSPFGRKRFGLAFFWSGHAVLGAGLLLILAAQLVGYLFEPHQSWFLRLGLKAPSPLATDRPLQFLALGLVLAGMYAYVYSDVVVRRVGVYIYLAVFMLLWAEVLVVDLFQLPITQELAIIVLALTSVAANLLRPTAERGDQPGSPLARAGQPIGFFLSTLPVLLGLSLHVRAFYGTYTITGAFVGAMLVTALACRFGAYLSRHSAPRLSATYFFGTAAATLVGAAGLLTLAGLTTWQQQAPLLMVIPVLYAVAARLYRGHTPEEPLLWVAQAATGVMLASSLVAAFRGFLMVRGDSLNLALANFFALAALFYGLVAAFRKQRGLVYASTLTGCGAVWQLLNYGAFADVSYIATFAAVGLLLLIAYRFALPERLNVRGLADTAFRCGNALLTLATVAGALLTLSELAAGDRQARTTLVAMLFGLVVLNLLAVGLVRHAGWRRWYLVATVGQCVLTVLVFAVFGALTLGEKLEITSVVLGLALLAVGHVGWYREQERQSDLTSWSLFLGSVLTSLPLTIALLTYRSRDVFHWPDELGMLATGILLLATGFMFHLRATTLTGAVQVALYIVTLLIYLPWDRVSSAAIAIMVGGGTLFVIGLVLSVYRDRLLTLPDRVRRREGLFRVLGWR